MSKLIKEQIDIIDPDWKPTILDRCNLLSIPNYITNEKVTKLFSDNKVISWQVIGGHIWLEVKSY